MSTDDHHPRRAALANTDTATLERRLTKIRRGFARIGKFPSRRRAEDRPYFALVDEIERRRTDQGRS